MHRVATTMPSGLRPSQGLLGPHGVAGSAGLPRRKRNVLGAFGDDDGAPSTSAEGDASVTDVNPAGCMTSLAFEGDRGWVMVRAPRGADADQLRDAMARGEVSRR